MKEMILEKLGEYQNDDKISKYCDYRIYELIGETFGNVRLERLISDEDFVCTVANSRLISPPKYIYKIIDELAGQTDSKSIFDPCITVASPLLHLRKNTLSGVCRNQTEIQLLDKLVNDCSSVQTGNVFEIIQQNPNRYDLLLSVPPIGERMEKGTGIHPDFATSLILESSKLLKEEGQIIAFTSSHFCSESKVKQLLQKYGLFVEAIFILPAGSLKPVSGIVSNLVVLSKRKAELTFVAELSENDLSNQTVLRNFKKHNDGEEIQSGTWVDFTCFDFPSSKIVNLRG